MTTNPFRITRWYFKLLYIVVAYAVILGIGSLVQITPLGDGPASAVISTVLLIGAFLLGARVFRSASELSPEALAAPRPWWRMTGTQVLSGRLGILFVALEILVLVGIWIIALGIEYNGRPLIAVSLASSIGTAVLYAVLAFLYLNSSRHLKSDEGLVPLTTGYAQH